MANGAKVSITGRLTKDPQKSTTKNNTTQVTFSVAVNTTKKVEEKYISNFYNVSVWGQLAEYIYPKIGKGQLVQVYGDLMLDTYTYEGKERQSLNVKGTDVIPLSKKEEPSNEPF